MKTDAEIKRAVLSAIKWNSTIEEDQIVVRVNKGWITLEGQVQYEFQKTKAKNLAEDIIGAAGITNRITIASPMAATYII
jgi:osmotically-inducible protein OsmY